MLAIQETSANLNRARVAHEAEFGIHKYLGEPTIEAPQIAAYAHTVQQFCTCWSVSMNPGGDNMTTNRRRLYEVALLIHDGGFDNRVLANPK